MNCKKGDLAILIGTGPAAGAIVRCIERYDGPWKNPLTGEVTPFGVIPGWRLDRPLPAKHSNKLQMTRADKWLRPIRDSDGEDEMLRIAGRPIGITEGV